MFADEELVMELLVNAGQARSDAMEAIRCAGQKDWQGATQLMASSESACLQAHKIPLCRAKRLAGRNSANGQF
nr:PTS lactose/cellobiose transporter subunit IIA [Escherichia coli]